MRNNKYVFFIFFCLAQVLIILLLLRVIALKTDNFTQIFHRIWIVPRQKKSVDIIESSTLKYYYEPKALGQMVYDLSFVGINKEVVQNINADGLNDLHTYEVNKPDFVYRIITLGDSFTEGALVATQDNWTEKLEDTLNSSMYCSNISKYEVINLGVGGYDMQYILERFKRKGLKYKADLVIFLAGQDDFDFPNELLLGKVKRLENEFDISPERLNDLRSKGDMYPSYTLAFQELIEERGNDAMNNIINDEFAYLNELMDMIPNAFIITPYSPLPEAMLTTVQAYVDGHNNAYYIPYGGDFDRFKDGHPTPIGHTTLAKNLFNAVLQANIIPCDTQK